MDRRRFIQLSTAGTTGILLNRCLPPDPPPVYTPRPFDQVPDMQGFTMAAVSPHPNRVDLFLNRRGGGIVHKTLLIGAAPGNDFWSTTAEIGPEGDVYAYERDGRILLFLNDGSDSLKMRVFERYWSEWIALPSTGAAVYSVAAAQDDNSLRLLMRDVSGWTWTGTVFFPIGGTAPVMAGWTRFAYLINNLHISNPVVATDGIRGTPLYWATRDVTTARFYETVISEGGTPFDVLSLPDNFVIWEALAVNAGGGTRYHLFSHNALFVERAARRDLGVTAQRLAPVNTWPDRKPSADPVRREDRIDVFALVEGPARGENALMTSRVTATGLVTGIRPAWESIGSSVYPGGVFTAISAFPGRVDLFVNDSSGGLWHRWRDERAPGGRWHPA